MSTRLTTVNFFAPVEEIIPRVEARMRDRTNGHHPDLHAALEHILASGGKRVRPTVALLAGGMLEADEDRLITLAAAIELLHTATLVHDDLIDGALLRRGMPTLNAEWSPAATILTGDYIFSQAAKYAAETESVDIMRMFAETLSTIVNGEITQIFKSRGLASRKDYFQRIYAKTASLFELAAAAPVFLSPGDDGFFDDLRLYGREVGTAFQIVDDVLDFTGEQATVGKPVASDLRRGLITLPALYYLDQYPDNPDFEKTLNGGGLNDDIVERLVKSIRGSGAIERALNEADRYVQRGIDALSEMPDNPKRQALEDLAAFVVRRPS